MPFDRGLTLIIADLYSSLGNTTLVIGAILTICGFIGIVWKKFIKPLTRIDNAMPTLLGIADEFTPNGGNSLRDRINKLQDHAEGIDAKLEKQSKSIDEIITQVNRMSSTQAENWEKANQDTLEFQKSNTDADLHRTRMEDKIDKIETDVHTMMASHQSHIEKDEDRFDALFDALSIKKDPEQF